MLGEFHKIPRFLTSHPGTRKRASATDAEETQGAIEPRRIKHLSWLGFQLSGRLQMVDSKLLRIS
jgi:hypothetical protein